MVQAVVTSNKVGHDFPTGFAFARQWWLEVSATTADGDPRAVRYPDAVLVDLHDADKLDEMKPSVLGSGTGILSHYYGTEVADGFFHSFSGWAIYIAAFVMLFSLGWILDRFRPTQPESVEKLTETTDEHSSVTSAGTVVPVEGVE